jgi:hypothetical protein
MGQAEQERHKYSTQSERTGRMWQQKITGLLEQVGQDKNVETGLPGREIQDMTAGTAMTGGTVKTGTGMRDRQTGQTEQEIINENRQFLDTNNVLAGLPDPQCY